MQRQDLHIKTFTLDIVRHCTCYIRINKHACNLAWPRVKGHLNKETKYLQIIKKPFRTYYIQKPIGTLEKVKKMITILSKFYLLIITTT